ncbi:hypothetical protein GCM10027184_38200 [Saccharothrix stipae]
MNQAALDTCLSRSDPDAKARFAYITGDSLVPQSKADVLTEPIDTSQVNHPTDGNGTGTRGTVYPWGDQPAPAKCNVRENGFGSTTPGDCP